MAFPPLLSFMVAKTLLTSSASFDPRNFGSPAWSAASSLAGALAAGTDGLISPSVLLKSSAHVSIPPGSRITAWVWIRLSVRLRVRLRSRLRVRLRLRLRLRLRRVRVRVRR